MAGTPLFSFLAVCDGGVRLHRGGEEEEDVCDGREMFLWHTTLLEPEGDTHVRLPRPLVEYSEKEKKKKKPPKPLKPWTPYILLAGDTYPSSDDTLHLEGNLVDHDAKRLFEGGFFTRTALARAPRRVLKAEPTSTACARCCTTSRPTPSCAPPPVRTSRA